MTEHDKKENDINENDNKVSKAKIEFSQKNNQTLRNVEKARKIIDNLKTSDIKEGNNNNE